jgi:hypothetical protein
VLGISLFFVRSVVPSSLEIQVGKNACPYFVSPFRKLKILSSSQLVCQSLNYYEFYPRDSKLQEKEKQNLQYSESLFWQAAYDDNEQSFERFLSKENFFFFLTKCSHCLANFWCILSVEVALED